MDENKVIVSTEMKQTLVNLRNLEEIYVIMSGVTKMPFVLCDEETFDDEVLVYYQEESAKEKAKTLAEDRYHVGIAKIEKNARLGFFTNLYTMGVNALAVNVGTEEEIRIQLEHLVVRKNKEETDRESGASSDSNVSDAGDAPQYRTGDAGECEGTSGRDDGAL